MVHKSPEYRAKIAEAKEELRECDPYITTPLLEAAAITGRCRGMGKMTAEEYEEYMEEIKKISGDFHNKCSCVEKIGSSHMSKSSHIKRY